MRILKTLLPLVLPAIAQKPPIQITADLSEAPRKLYHAEVEIPVTPGPLTLITPEWIPGNHRPTGPVADITGVAFTANGQTLPWRRDDTNLYEFHLTIPAGVTTLHAHLDCIVTARLIAVLCSRIVWRGTSYREREFATLLIPRGLITAVLALEVIQSQPAGLSYFPSLTFALILFTNLLVLPASIRARALSTTSTPPANELPSP